jgi:membrane protein
MVVVRPIGGSRSIRGAIVKQWQILMAGLAVVALSGAARRRMEDSEVPAGGNRRVARLPREEGDGPGSRGRPRGRDNEGGDAPDPKAGDAPPGAGLEPGRGRLADSPKEIPKRGWRDVLLRVKKQIGEDNVSLTAAGVAYGWLLAIFPLLGSFTSIYGLLADPADVQRQVEQLFGLLSPNVVEILHDQLTKLAEKSTATLGLGAFFGILFSLWSANSGTKAMMTALNIVYSEKEKRGFFKLNLVSLTITIGLVVAGVIALLLVGILPIIFRFIGLEDTVRALLNVLRWPLLAIGFMVFLAFLYRYAPSREKPKWRWVTWGSAVATVLWVLASGLFAFYVANFGKYDETYGSIGAVVVLMMWFYITAFIILLGAELNAELEHQTAKDSTTHAPKPMGRRGAHMADTLGETP